MGLMKRMMHEFEDLYNVNAMGAPYLASAHINGLCIRCGEPIETDKYSLCHKCAMWAYGDNSSS